MAHQNLLINQFFHFTPTDSTDYNRKCLREAGLVEYAIYDFGFSLMLPQSTDVRTCRHPHAPICYVTFHGLNDVMQGEHDYNPFAFDVGCLGHIFCVHLQVRSSI